MNDTSTLHESTRTQVRAYVARVRAALSDLPAEDVDDLTQGMEADLAELAAESDSIRARLGTPEAYADELRTAAGLAPRAAFTTTGVMGARLARWGKQRQALMALPWMRDALPVGWALRGIVAAWVVGRVLGWNSNNVWTWLLGAALSFWFGRKTLEWKGGRRGAISAINLATALIGLLVVLPNQVDRTDQPPAIYMESPATIDGLSNNGEPVTGITVYDPTGRQVERPRAFDQNGNPLLPGSEQDTYTPPASLEPLPQASTAPPTSPTTTPPASPSPQPSSPSPAGTPTHR